MNGILRTQIELKDPKTLKPYERNNKKHPKSQIKKLMAAIAEQGFDQPIVVDKHLVVIKGHARLEASLEMKLKQVPVIVASDLSPEQVRAARLADNTIADDAPLDLAAIKFELSELADLNYDLSFTGFDSLELDNLLSDLPTTEYQASQVFGSNDRWEVVQGEEQIAGKLREFAEQAGEGSEPEPQAKPPVGAKYPLSIVLSSGEFQAWKDYKDKIGEKQDTKAFLKLLDGE